MAVKQSCCVGSLQLGQSRRNTLLNDTPDAARHRYEASSVRLHVHLVFLSSVLKNGRTSGIVV